MVIVVCSVAANSIAVFSRQRDLNDKLTVPAEIKATQRDPARCLRKSIENLTGKIRNVSRYNHDDAPNRPN